MSRAIRGNSGFSLIELMIAMTIGLLLLSGLAMIFVNSSDTSRELQKTAQQIENGRFAIDVISQDLHLAGFYGHLHEVGAIPVPATIPPDPCEMADESKLLSALWYPVHGYRGTIAATTTTPTSDLRADVTAASCDTPWLASANLKEGSDVLVIRRADTNALARPPATAGVAIAGNIYLQSNTSSADVQIPTANVTMTPTNNAKNDPSSMRQIDTQASPIRRYRVHVYFVAPCSVPTGGGAICTGDTDDGGNPIPTLKRLELNAKNDITIVPLVEGIEYFKIEYGIDDTPTATNVSTGYSGDATVDIYKPAPTTAEWKNVIAAKLYVLARNTESTRGFIDNKTYYLGTGITVPVTRDGTDFKRHVYATVVQMKNPAGRREIP